MGYSDIRKRKQEQNIRQTDSVPSVVKFEVGKIYSSGTDKYVCLGRSFGKDGIEQIRMYLLDMAKDDLKELGYVCDEDCELMTLRVYKNIERCTECENTDDIEDYDIRADRPKGEIQLENPDFGKKKSKKSKRANPIAGILLIIIIAIIIRACTAGA